MLEWFKRNSYEISFFVAGWCTLACLHDLAQHDYIWAAVNGALAYVNIKMARW